MTATKSIWQTMPVKTWGGKLSNLSRLKRMGLSVPHAFGVKPGVKLDDELKSEVTMRVLGLGSNGVFAVRSSATSEDGVNDSFAGMHDSILNVKSQDVFDAIGKVRESVNTPQAKAYRKQKGLSKPRMAVVVQRMIDPLMSGVCFTVDPVTNDPTLMTIEYVYGLGDKLVSGETTPSSMSIRKDTPLPEGMALAYLTQKCIQLEGWLGRPQDIEWAIDKQGVLWFLQTRPITTLEK